MPVTAESLERSVEILRSHGATRVLVFGSAKDSPDTARDLDLACAGLTPRAFLDSVGDLLDVMDIAVDLIDLSERSAFTEFVEDNGRVLYERD